MGTEAWKYSDLAMERPQAEGQEGVLLERSVTHGLHIHRLQITSKEGAANVGRPIGRYHTVLLPASDCDSEMLIQVLCKELFSLLPKKRENILVAGLGNRELSPDALGPKFAARVQPTRGLKSHIPQVFSTLGVCSISVTAPGVPAQSGMETAEALHALCLVLKPDVVLAVDALATGSQQRLLRTVQLSDTGLFPGAGIGKGRSPLTKESLGVPVIAMGVPTVIDSRALLQNSSSTDEKENRQSKAPRMFLSPENVCERVDFFAGVLAEAVNTVVGIPAL